MKKLFLVLLALTVFGAFAFGQAAAPALKFSGYLNFGLLYSKVGSDDMIVQNGDDSATTGRLNWNMSYNAGDYGVNFRVRSQPTGGFSNSTGNMSGSGGLFLRRVYGWTNVVPGLVKIKAGRLDDYTWVAASGAYWNCFGNLDGPVGVQVQVTPMDGLNLGGFLPVQRTNDTILKASDQVKNIEIGFNYSQKDVFAVVGGYMGSNVKKQSDIWFGGSLFMVPGLTADFEGVMANSGDKPTGYNFVFEALYYTMDAIKVGAQMSQQMFADSANKSQIYIGPEAAYTLSDTLTVGVFTSIALKDGKTGYGVGPYVKLITAKSSFIKVQAGMNGGDWAPAAGAVVYKTPSTWVKPSDDQTYAMVDFVWNF